MSGRTPVRRDPGHRIAEHAGPRGVLLMPGRWTSSRADPKRGRATNPAARTSPVTFIPSPRAGDLVAGPGMTFLPCR